jgi:hypothetical protein
LEGKITVCPPCKITPMEGKALDNFWSSYSQFEN